MVPDDRKYTQEHEWVLVEDGEIGTIGVTDFAAGELGDIVFVELPEVGDEFSQGDTVGTIESVKAVADLFIPVSGEIVEINEAVVDGPEMVNSNPMDDGWLIKVKLSDRRAGRPDGRRRPTTTCWRLTESMPYVPHSPADIRAMLEVIGKDSVDDLFAHLPAERPPGPAAGSARRTDRGGGPALFPRRWPRPQPRPGRAGLVPGRRRLRRDRPGGDRRAGLAFGVPDRLHAVPARGLPGHPAGHLRVAVLHLPADRHGCFQRQHVRRRHGPGRSPLGRHRRRPQAEHGGAAGHPEPAVRPRGTHGSGRRGDHDPRGARRSGRDHRYDRPAGPDERRRRRRGDR